MTSDMFYALSANVRNLQDSVIAFRVTLEMLEVKENQNTYLLTQILNELKRLNKDK